VHAWLLLAAVRVGLRVLSFKTVMRLLGPKAGGCAPTHAPQNPDPERLAALVEMAARHQRPAPTCLHKTVTVYGLLRHHGIDVELVISAGRSDGTLDAHAWSEHMGRPLLRGQAPSGHEPLLRWRGGAIR
jgi:transglutaminase superfamily protein